MHDDGASIKDNRSLTNERRRLVHTFSSLAEIGEEISHKQDFQETVRNALHLLLGSLGIMRGGVARFSRSNSELNMVAARGLGDDFPLTMFLASSDEKELSAAGVTSIDRDRAKELRAFSDGRIDLCRLELLVPLVIRGELFGMVFVGAKATGETYSSYDREVISAMARHIGVAISQRNMIAELERHASENRRLYEALRMTYHDTVQAFAAAIDRKDKYTEGHSVRVGKYSAIIACELGWDEHQTEGAAVAGYLHDVGKITVERKIINAPYRINAKESSELNRHPRTGYDILMPINHPYADVPLAAKYHHERLDGRGYPDGLRDSEIPYIAKIVSLADSFDAMTTDRPYRRRRKPDEVFVDLKRNVGTQFAPEIVDALLKGMHNELTGRAQTREFRRLLGRKFMETEGIVSMLQSALSENAPLAIAT